MHLADSHDSAHSPKQGLSCGDATGRGKPAATTLASSGGQCRTALRRMVVCVRLRSGICVSLCVCQMCGSVCLSDVWVCVSAKFLDLCVCPMFGSMGQIDFRVHVSVHLSNFLGLLVRCFGLCVCQTFEFMCVSDVRTCMSVHLSKFGV